MAEKILVVGGGGREHAIIKALKKSPDCGEIWCAPGNGGISYDAKCKNIKSTDVDTMVGFAVEEKFDYVVVAQDDPLALGMVDALAAVGIPAFGPDKAAARIEASKVFSKDLMKKYGIPTAKYEAFDDPAKVMDYIRAEGKYPVVIKADGLALGKGVLICENEQQAADGVKEIMLDKKFGASGNHVVVEEFLTGPEVSVLSFTDGKVVKPMVSSMDHKRANDHDTGLNTGGMGTIAPNPYYTPEVAAECMEKIFLPTIKAMNAEGCPFKGCLYFGLMLTPDGPKVIEYNCRFGDPETQVVLPLLEGDLLRIMQAAEGIKEIMLDKKFGASGNHVVVEEFLTGPEVSVLSFTDGKVVKPMVSSMDHKRANDHDTGLNTGGMGTIAPNPYYTPEVAAECMEKIFLPTIKAMNAEGCPFKGCLYFGLMLTPDGPKVIEYNCRFGDPETQVVLPLLEGDLLHIMQACTNGTLENEEVKFSDGAAACVILASGGYPVAYEKGKPITGLVDGQLPGEENVTVYHSGTAITEDGTLVTAGGRVLGVTATGPRLTNALSHAYEAAEKISFEKLHKRSDIGLRALKALAEKE